MRKRVQEGNALKKTNLQMWMHLLQNISLDDIWFAQGFPNFTYTQKRRRPYIF